MDIREEFEKSEHLKERLAICWYDEKIGCYLSIQLCDYASASYLNGAWYAFQKQQKEINELNLKMKRLRLIMTDYYTGSFDESAEMAGLISEVLLDESQS